MIRRIPARKSSLSMIKWSTSFQWTAISLQSLWRCWVFSVCVRFQLVAVCDSLTCICVFCVNQWLSPLFLCLWLEITSCSVRLWAIRDQQCPQILFILFFFHQTSTSSPLWGKKKKKKQQHTTSTVPSQLVNRPPVLRGTEVLLVKSSRFLPDVVLLGAEPPELLWTREKYFLHILFFFNSIFFIIILPSAYNKL